MSRRRRRAAEPTGLFAVACPGCGATVAVKSSRVGSAARCPACRGLFLVPEPRLPPTPTTAVPAEPEPAAPEPLPALAAPPSPPVVASAAPATTPFDDLEPPAIAGPSEFGLQEPVRTIEAHGCLIELRRISEEERRHRKARRTMLTLLVGSAILAGLVWFLVR